MQNPAGPQDRRPENAEDATKIVAYSKVPASTPFVHLGYLAASTSNPVPGLLWGGVVIVIAAIASKPLFSIVGKRFLRRKSPESVQALGLPARRLRLVEWTLFLLGIMVIASAFAFGEKVHIAPDRLTHTRVVVWGQYLKSSESDNDAGVVIDLPTQQGEYDLRSVLGVAGRPIEGYTDGWNTPLVLRAAQHEGQLTFTVVSAGPDRTLDTQDDITSLEFVETRQIIHLQEDGSKQSPSSDPI